MTSRFRSPLCAISGRRVTRQRRVASEPLVPYPIARQAFPQSPVGPWRAGREPVHLGVPPPLQAWARPADFPFGSGTCLAAPRRGPEAPRRSAVIGCGSGLELGSDAAWQPQSARLSGEVLRLGRTRGRTEWRSDGLKWGRQKGGPTPSTDTDLRPRAPVPAQSRPRRGRVRRPLSRFLPSPFSGLVREPSGEWLRMAEAGSAAQHLQLPWSPVATCHRLTGVPTQAALGL